MYAQRLDSQEMKKEMKQIRARVNRNYKELSLLRESQQSLTQRFINQYGVGSSSPPQPIPQPQQGVNEDGDDDIDFEALTMNSMRRS